MVFLGWNIDFSSCTGTACHVGGGTRSKAYFPVWFTLCCCCCCCLFLCAWWWYKHRTFREGEGVKKKKPNYTSCLIRWKVEPIGGYQYHHGSRMSKCQSNLAWWHYCELPAVHYDMNYSVGALGIHIFANVTLLFFALFRSFRLQLNSTMNKQLFLTIWV